MKKDDYSIVDGFEYPILVKLSPQDMLNGYKMGFDKWKEKYPKGNYELLISTVTALFKKKIVVTTQGNLFIYFDINNIWEAFKDDFPNDLLNFLEEEKIN